MASPPPRPPPPPDTLTAQQASQGYPPAGSFNMTDTPPPPPPKPGASNSGASYGRGPAPTPPTDPTYASQYQQQEPPAVPAPPGVDEGWLPELLREQSKPDLETLLSSPQLLDSLLRSPSTAHPSMPASDALVRSALNQNQSLATHISSLAGTVAAQRADVASRLVQLRALERQWNIKQSAMDDALAPFSPKALHARLVAGIGEREGVLSALEESFLEEDGRASERELADFVKRWRDARKVLALRRERRRRFEEGRVGGWR